MHDFFATAKFTLSPGSIPLPDGESTPPMQAIMSSFGEADIVPFAPAQFAARNSRSRQTRSRRRPSSSVLRSLSSVL
jgi:hypothetical protein